MISAAIVAKKLAIVITMTSRLITCVTSCASTPSSSAGSRPRFSRPRVAQIVADFCERPSAQAFGIRASITAIFGLGRSAWMHSRSMISCSCGSSEAETSWAPSVLSAILSEPTICTLNSATAITTISSALVLVASRAPISAA